MAENSGNGLPDEGQSPESGHRMAAEGMPFPWAVERRYEFYEFGGHLGNVGFQLGYPANQLRVNSRVGARAVSLNAELF